MSQQTIKGSCLCGSVSYSITGDVQRFYHCHCSRCRKATGAERGSNLLVTPVTSITWLKGEDLLCRYKVPEAERFFNCFCRQCGSSMPREVNELDGVLVPAGTLDSPSPAKPQAHIFWDSKADWTHDNTLPRHAEYPEGI